MTSYNLGGRHSSGFGGGKHYRSVRGEGSCDVMRPRYAPGTPSVSAPAVSLRPRPCPPPPCPPCKPPCPPGSTPCAPPCTPWPPAEDGNACCMFDELNYVGFLELMARVLLALTALCFVAALAELAIWGMTPPAPSSSRCCGGDVGGVGGWLAGLGGGGRGGKGGSWLMSLLHP